MLQNVTLVTHNKVMLPHVEVKTMQDYITGILEVNEPIETYHGIAFSRRLIVRTLYGKTIEIHDVESITGDLKPGKRYDIVIAVSGVEKVRAFTHSNSMSAKFSGTIRQLKWVPEPDKYLVYNEDEMKEPMSIIGTANGHVLLSRMLLGGVSVGNAVTWGKDNFNLVAVYK